MGKIYGVSVTDKIERIIGGVEDSNVIKSVNNLHDDFFNSFNGADEDAAIEMFGAWCLILGVIPYRKGLVLYEGSNDYFIHLPLMVEEKDDGYYEVVTGTKVDTSKLLEFYIDLDYESIEQTFKVFEDYPEAEELYHKGIQELLDRVNKYDKLIDEAIGTKDQKEETEEDKKIADLVHSFQRTHRKITNKEQQ